MGVEGWRLGVAVEEGRREGGVGDAVCVMKVLLVEDTMEVRYCLVLVLVNLLLRRLAELDGPTLCVLHLVVARKDGPPRQLKICGFWPG